ncbi:hypothetical protein [Leptospira noguchii]|uniref:Uncharacterized protein n=1 Tax=Leptospira noguchii str. 2001034031 TaxID=1193053 RepID=M6YWH8_9LEPT|nr:hypothetical protein [Leptospira noguchii]EMO90738.1 hypothetical protein LEP1GSC024_0355 [Leptospira noguchii str. 2001034031]
MSSGKGFAEFNFDSKILSTCGVGYDRESSIEFIIRPDFLTSNLRYIRVVEK